jgi:U3 small nucleolar RNA-associated protein 20
MASYMEAHRLETFLVHILSPVYRITEDDTIRDPQMGEPNYDRILATLTPCFHPDEIKALAVELQDLIQTKVGTTKFANAYSRIRQSILSVRRDRKTARIMQVSISHNISII